VRRAFTLIELLVVIAILALLMAIVTASLLNVRVAAKSFVCKNKLRNVAFDFIRFADDFSPPWRGDSDKDGKPGFCLLDFQEREYGVAEFWKTDAVPMASVGPAALLTSTYDASEQPLICPAGPQHLERRPMTPIHKKAVLPVEHVSVGMNMRLYRTTIIKDGQYEFRDIRLSKRILEHPMIPLAFDVDGVKALEIDAHTPVGVLPYFAAPPLDTPDAYRGGEFWFPSFRHGGKMNAAFVGGQVLSSVDPLHGAGWNWQQPPSAR